jgi:excisionase family DNA binding protein
MAGQSTVHRGPVAVIDGRSCHLLNAYLGKLRTRVRGQDADFDAALLTIYRAGLEYAESSARGTPMAAKPEPAPRLNPYDTVSTTTAATILHVTDRAIRKAITEKRLPATKVEGRYRITKDDLAAFMAER